MKISNLILVFLLSVSARGGSVIGNGGDPLTYFLEATRYAYIDTLKTILNDSSQSSSFCKLKKLNEAQVEFCKSFVFKTGLQALILNQNQSKVSFLIREEPLLVKGPDGKPMPVSARTELGPSGPIEFHRDSIKLYSPVQMLFLLAHEIGHKVQLDNSFVNDLDPVGPFQTGRELLDSVAKAISEIAEQKGKIGTSYGLRDNFECVVSVNGNQLGALLSTPRLFLNPDLMSYQSSLGRNPRDPKLYIPESNNSNLVFQFIISEPENCAENPKFLNQRKTEISIWRHFKPWGSDPVPPDELVAQQKLLGLNLLCKQTLAPITLSYQNTNFTCSYSGTEGVTDFP